MTDLEYVLACPLDLIDRYCDTLSQEKSDLFLSQLQSWRAGTKPPTALIKMVASSLRRLDPSAHTERVVENAVKKVDLITAEQEMIERARNNVEDFVWYVTDKKPAYHHKLWMYHIFNHDYTNIIAPPGSAKTTLSQAILTFIMGKNPLLTNSIVSVSDAQAQARLTGIKAVIEHNERFHNVFPHIQINNRLTNNMNMFSVLDDRLPYSAWMTHVQQKGHPNDATLFAAGFGNSGIIGKRWSGYCFIDDMVDQTMLTAKQMEEADAFVKLTLMSRLVPNMGRMVNIGTRWMVGDLIQKLQDNSEWFTLEMAAIWHDEDSRPHSYWPELWDLDTLERKRRTMITDDGSDRMFQLMYLNNTSVTAAGLFDEEVLGRDLPEDVLDRVIKIYITTDWALKTKEQHDFSVFLAVGIDKENRFYILDMLRIKQGPESSPQALGEFADQVALDYGLRVGLQNILIEGVAFQTVMGTLLQQARPDLPYVAVPPKGDKGFRAKLVSNAAHTGRLFINQRSKDLQTLKREWINFGTAKHDDTLDPMGLLIQYLGSSAVTARVRYHKSRFLL
jgi:predicted phage terminase large subunit-like protein